MTEEHTINPYKTIVRGEPLPFEKIETTNSNTVPVRKKLITHALVRCENDGTNISPEEQKIGAFTGFMSTLSFHYHFIRKQPLCMSSSNVLMVPVLGIFL